MISVGGLVPKSDGRNKRLLGNNTNCRIYEGTTLVAYTYVSIKQCFHTVLWSFLYVLKTQVFLENENNFSIHYCQKLAYNEIAFGILSNFSF